MLLIRLFCRLETMTNKNSVLKNKRYLEVTYGETRRAEGEYPDKLAKYLMEKYFKKPGRILDIGCGNGDFLRAFSRLGFDVVGVDISPDVQDRLGEEFEVHLVDVEDEESLLKFSEKFDFVFSKSVIEHMREPITLFNLANECLKSDGVAAIMCPSWEHTYWGPYYIDHTHVTPFTRPSLEESFTLAGFDKSDCWYFYQLPFLWKYPWLKIFAQALSKLPIPYAPWNKVPWAAGHWINKIVRFSKEVMLLGVATKSENK